MIGASEEVPEPSFRTRLGARQRTTRKGDSTANLTQLDLLFSCRRIRCITLMILREFVSTIATSSSTAR
jgi:hypothetical protein